MIPGQIISKDCERLWFLSVYHKVENTSTFCLEARTGFFRLSMKGNLMFIYCELLGKCWFPYYKHALTLATLQYKFFLLVCKQESENNFNVWLGWILCFFHSIFLAMTQNFYSCFTRKDLTNLPFMWLWSMIWCKITPKNKAYKTLKVWSKVCFLLLLCIRVLSICHT